MSKVITTRALGLCSGGLDSILAGLVLKRQGVDVTWVTFETPFFSAENSVKASKMTGIELIRRDITKIYLKMLKAPPCGYGKHMNPCKDCHSLMFRLAGEMMNENGFHFLFSGEVVGQRPLSQTKHALRYVEMSSGFAGHILRPLSAKNLPETDVEAKGLVDREQLYDIAGRSRKSQIQLAKEFHVKNYPAPAGGCLLTERNYSNRLKDLFSHQDSYTSSELHLLKFGRHIRLNKHVKLIVGRTRYENNSLRKHYDPEKYMIVDVIGIGSPTILVPSDADTESVKMAASICVGYTKLPKGQNTDVTVTFKGKSERVNVPGISTGRIQTLVI
jgi:tRNA-specific 2-thiouridylase